MTTEILLSVLAMAAGVIGAHFMGIEQAKAYTDKKMSELHKKFEVYDYKFEKLMEKMSIINDTVIEIKTIIKQEK